MKLYLSIACVLGIALLMACPVQATAPKVESTSVANGTVDVPLDTVIRITFSTQMNVSHTESAISMRPDAINFIEACPTTLLARGCTKFDINMSLMYGVHYTITISTSAKDVDGVHLADEYVLSFTTIRSSSQSQTQQILDWITSNWLWLALFLVIIVVLVAVYYRKR